MTDLPERLSNLSEDERVQAIKKSEQQGRAGIGQPGVESATGRDRAGEDLPRSAGTNQGPVDLSDAVPNPPTRSEKADR